jgi:hypothetical protein
MVVGVRNRFESGMQYDMLDACNPKSVPCNQLSRRHRLVLGRKFVEKQSANRKNLTNEVESLNVIGVEMGQKHVVQTGDLSSHR